MWILLFTSGNPAIFIWAWPPSEAYQVGTDDSVQFRGTLARFARARFVSVRRSSRELSLDPYYNYFLFRYFCY